MLRIAVCGEEPKEELRSACTEDALRQVYDLAQRHDLAHLVGYAINKLSLPGSEVGKQVQQAVALAVFRHTRLDNELRQINRVLEQAGITFVPLKGAVIRNLYPEPWMRTSGDIDILVREADLDAARDSLVQKLAYTTDGQRHYHDIWLVAPSGFRVELHFSIQENMPSIDAALCRVWEHTTGTAGCRCTLTNEFLAFHVIAHMSYHFAWGGCGIRPFLDTFLLVRQGDLDEAVLRGYLSQCGIETFYDHVLALIGVWFRGEEPTPTIASMAEFVLNGGTYGSKQQRLVVAQEREGGKLRYLLGRVFLPYDRMKLKYPVLQRRPILLPLLHVRRWIELFFGGKLSRAVTEVRNCKDIDKNQAEAVGNLLRRLGLL